MRCCPDSSWLCSRLQFSCFHVQSCQGLGDFVALFTLPSPKERTGRWNGKPSGVLCGPQIFPFMSLLFSFFVPAVHLSEPFSRKWLSSFFFSVRRHADLLVVSCDALALRLFLLRTPYLTFGVAPLCPHVRLSEHVSPPISLCSQPLNSLIIFFSEV